MRIRTVDVSQSDKQSARVFFAALLEMFEFETVLDMFARDGALTVSSYVEKVPDLYLWELCPEHAEALSTYNPQQVRIGCSYRSMLQDFGTYDLIVVDTPQGIHSDYAGNPHVEHFDVVKGIRKFVGHRAVIVLYVNKRPYDRDEVGSHGYDEYDEYDFGKWMVARQTFYGGNPREITEAQALRAYTECLNAQGLTVRSVLTVPCFSDVEGVDPYAFRVAIEVTR